MVLIRKFFFGLRTQKGSPVAHSPYIICSAVGWSIASISDFGEAIYLGASCLSRIYRLWTSLPYYIHHISHTCKLSVHTRDLSSNDLIASYQIPPMVQGTRYHTTLYITSVTFCQSFEEHLSTHVIIKSFHLSLPRNPT